MTIQTNDPAAWQQLVNELSVGQKPGIHIIISSDDRDRALKLIHDDVLYDAFDLDDITTLIDVVSLRQIGGYAMDFIAGTHTVGLLIHQRLHQFAQAALVDAVNANLEQRINYYDNGRSYGLTGCEL